ncbi:NADH dehydrogenase [ubiquinone] 1 beta subcomplex subunit 9 [Bradysia coprophila]|uniref:NADH dehydrogenase [ubiquinone] 1 beta subcomplex subunit 9 n=1 Tax=Bradysia coprophila TaxID=38358 RepID=UPI00187D834E|nr:NADH dehydrogenase [ubiquinone] 1 beta subcomplex subunit 9 [Bradysia coprophila]
MAGNLPTGIYTHSQRVCRLYKASLRNLESWYDRRWIFRYHAVLLRARFDQNKNLADMVKARALVAAGERENNSKLHPIPKKFANSPGGCAYEREVIPPDWILDYWHPLEKAQYPEYFARREQRKKEYVIWWEKQYGKHEPEHHH